LWPDWRHHAFLSDLDGDTGHHRSGPNLAGGHAGSAWATPTRDGRSGSRHRTKVVLGGRVTIPKGV
jgi:hypothetical protein